MLTKYLSVFFISMVPIIELRGAIPIGVGLGLPLWQVYIIAIIGNMIPVPFIFFFARKVLEWGADKPVIGKFFTFCLEKGHKGGGYIYRTDTQRGNHHAGKCCLRWSETALCLTRTTHLGNLSQQTTTHQHQFYHH